MLKKMKSFIPATLVAGLAMAPQAQAVVHGEEYTQQVEATQAQFFDADGFVIDEDIDQWFGDDWYSAERFPDQNGSAMFMPDAEMSAAQKAVLLLDYLEGSLPHARYRVRFGTDFPYVEGEVSTPWAYVEVARFNLGPAKREELSQYADTVAAAEEFGVGPHVVRRFVFTPIQGQQAHLVQAARAELDDEQAQAEQCFGQSCLSLDEIIGTVGNWEEVSAPPAELVVVTEAAAAPRNQTPDEVAAELVGSHIGPEYGEIVESVQAPEPFLELVISKNIEGQELAITAVSQQGHVMDDAIAGVWFRRLQVAGMDPHWERLLQHRRVEK